MRRTTLILLGAVVLASSADLLAQTLAGPSTPPRTRATADSTEVLSAGSTAEQGGAAAAQVDVKSWKVTANGPGLLTFDSGRLKNGSVTTYNFTTQTDNGVVRLLVDSAGTNEGAVPDGWAEVALRVQDEVHGRGGKTITSSDVFGRIVATSRSFGYTDDPRQGRCRGDYCPETLHVGSDRNLRLMANGGGQFDLIVGNRQALTITRDKVYLPDFKAGQGLHTPICADDTGALSRCDSPDLVTLQATIDVSRADVLRLQSRAAGPPPRDLFTVRGDGRVRIPSLASSVWTGGFICVDDQGNLLSAGCGLARLEIVIMSVMANAAITWLVVAGVTRFRGRTGTPA